MGKRYWSEYRKQKYQFRSYYCAGCRQKKPCGLLTNFDRDWKGYCCSCYYRAEKQKAQEYNSYKKVLADKQKEQKDRAQQLKLLRAYSGCKKCGSKEVDGYDLLVNNKLVCRDCLIKKTGGASGELSWEGQQKWYRKR